MSFERTLRVLAGNQPLHIGTADAVPGLRESGELTIPYHARSAHLHVVGRTRSGKSRFVADLIRQDIQAGHGLCLIDPHGELYDLTMGWLAEHPHMQRWMNPVHPVRFTDPKHTFKYNPLAIEHPDEAYSVASNVTNAITRIYGGKDSTETPLTWFVLDVTCTILALRGLPLAAAKYFLQSDTFSRDLRDKISDGLPNEYYRQLGLEFSRMTPREFRETIGSTARRLHQFLKNPLVERIFSTTENTASLSRVMDEQQILLLDTSDQGGLVDFDQLRTIGMLFVNNLFATARKRDPKTKPTPFFLYIDEAQNYLSSDIEHILSQAAKRGLYLTLAHQYLGQLLAAGEEIYRGVMSGTLMKAVFGVTMDDADVFVDELFADHIDFQRVKEKLSTPHVVDYEVVALKGATKGRAQGLARANAHGDAVSDTDSEGENYGSGKGLGNSLGLTTTLPGDTAMPTIDTPLSLSNIEVESSNSIEMFGRNKGRAQTRTTSNIQSLTESATISESESLNETLKSLFSWFSTTAYSLEEQRYDLKRRIAYQPERHGFLAVRRSGTIGFTTRPVPDPLDLPIAEAELLARLRSASPWIVPAEEVPRLLDHPGLREFISGPKTRPKDEPDDYFEPD